MDNIVLGFKYREVCAIKHALERRVKDKYNNLSDSMPEGLKKKNLKEIVDETVLIDRLEKVLVEHKR